MATEAVEHPRLLPGVLVPDPDAGTGPLRRSTRDWAVDLSMFLLAALFGGLVWGTDSFGSSLPDPVKLAEVLYGAALCGALWVRRRWPMAVAIASVPAAAFSSAASGAAIVALFTLAVHRRWPAAVVIGALQLAVTPLYLSLHPGDDAERWVVLVVVGFGTVAVIASGMFVRARRQLVLSLRDRAQRAEAEQQLRVEQARQAERARIAREMHDVLAHRISLVSLHAGVLEFRADASPEEVARAAAVIRASAHQALGDLREVIGVLRETNGGGPPEPPQPTLADLPALLDESRAAGMRLDVHVDLDELAAVPASVGRSALRIVQEALTNARKHAPGARVTVHVAGAAGDGLTVDVRNPAPVGVAPHEQIPGAGTGLVGLTERAVLAGGELQHGRTADGSFRLHAWLPWPA